MSWKINRVSAKPERIFRAISHEYTPPFGFVIYGADSQLKDDVYSMFIDQTGSLLTIYCQPLNYYIGQIKTRFKRGEPVIVCLDGGNSLVCDRNPRIADRLHRLGAKTIVGVYVEASQKDTISLSAIDGSRGIDFGLATYFEQIEQFIANPPSSSGYDLTVTIDSN